MVDLICQDPDCTCPTHTEDRDCTIDNCDCQDCGNHRPD